jgi:hypothetical protein
MRTALLLVVFAVALGLVPTASAANRSAKEKAAKKACLAGDAAKGVEILAGLYVDTNDPTCIFNQGRCFEQTHRY